MNSEYSLCNALDRVGGVGPADGGRGGLGDAQVADLTGGHQLGQCPPGVLHRHRGVHPVLVVEVDVVDPEPLERRVARPPHVVGPAVHADERAVRSALVAELGGQRHLVPAPGDGPAHQPLVGERSVHVGRVQEGDARVERLMDGGHRLLVVGRTVGLAHAHAPEAHGRYLETLTAQPALFHSTPSSPIGPLGARTQPRCPDGCPLGVEPTVVQPGAAHTGRSGARQGAEPRWGRTATRGL